MAEKGGFAVIEGKHGRTERSSRDGKPLISIVDDDESIRIGTASLIRSLGFAVGSFPSAEAFLKADEPDRSCCMISDVKMPGMSGLEMVRRLRALPCLLQVIFVSAWNLEEVCREVIALGNSIILVKPLVAERLSVALETVWDK
ncbi:response regulator [Paraburkholderia sp. SIMBA_053]|uniref:response regulator n=1 Tax=Paraburkholderia sp. SIMBA_053 TaxID=3085794 RepID=UPI00397C31F1